MKKKVWLSVAVIVVIVAILLLIGKVEWKKAVVSIDTWVIDTGIVSTWIAAVPTTGSVSVNFPAQPTALPWNYSGNWAMLRVWAEKNKQTLSIPEWASNVTLTFVLSKDSKYDQLPWNIQLSVDGKNLCNGRLNLKSSIDGLTNAPIYTFYLASIFTQDKPKWFDLSSAIGKDLVIKNRVGQSQTSLVSVTANYIK